MFLLIDLHLERNSLYLGYKLTDRISNIKGGIKVLKDLQYPKKIIDYTEKYINNLK